MDMNQLRRVSLVTGPTELAYAFDEFDGHLKIWIGEYVRDAHPSAVRATIAPGFTTWAIRNTNEIPVAGSAALPASLPAGELGDD